MTDRDESAPAAEAATETERAHEENRLIAERRAKLAALREQDGPTFPNDFRVTHEAGPLQTEHADATREALTEAGFEVAVAGRIVADRGAFLLLQDTSGRIQVYVNRKVLPAATLDARKGWDLGDIIGGVGTLARSGKGDLYVDLREARLLTKALRPLPDDYYGLHDVELRYRQRYVDLIVNAEARAVFRTRSRIVQAIRDWFVGHDFLEVETPMMHPIPGGATARPFVTHHNALDMPLYLRVAPELYLKRLVVGGFERVFEINRNFRNEGLSPRHNPEFTMLEFYWAYRTYEDLMQATEALIGQVAQKVLGTTRIDYQGQSIELAGPYRRLAITEALVQVAAVPAEELGDASALRERLQAADVQPKPDWGLGKLQFELFEALVEHRLIEPTFITRHPTEVSPLARQNDADPEVTDRFELYICGREIANGFSELNDPEEQAARFRAQAELKDAGDNEAMHYDEDYIRALEVGLPPTAGEGIGIDRLVMLLTNQTAIRDVLLFPQMRPRH